MRFFTSFRMTFYLTIKKIKTKGLNIITKNLDKKQEI